ncbi:PREDICTED: DDB1- and CUL4-associated factor 5-like [Galeopterus variegatus]|uniref:DDB1- and CUL4-associated factor 5-like n=1 Tax=Galeopterus variegatus TaxID=482537 RepID=A0ABM0SDM9_GALVR|nr:PREDICTED: DDB1- and CUL4-associated factor 5-like [Galeopterus variegatus]
MAGHWRRSHSMLTWRPLQAEWPQPPITTPATSRHPWRSQLLVVPQPAQSLSGLRFQLLPGPGRRQPPPWQKPQSLDPESWRRGCAAWPGAEGSSGVARRRVAATPRGFFPGRILDTNNGSSVEHSFETKKLNGKALSKVLSSQAEEPLSPPVPKGSGPTLNSRSGNCPRKQSDDSEERSLKTICANHNNGCLQSCPPQPRNNGQNFGEPGAVAYSSPECSDTDHDNSFLKGTLLHTDCCGPEMACETPNAGTREDPTDPPFTDSSKALHRHSSLKRHRVESEDADSENSYSEKKLKT